MESFPYIIICLWLAAALLQFGLPELEGRSRASIRFVQVACVCSSLYLLALQGLALPLWTRIALYVAAVYLVFFGVLFVPGLLARKYPHASGAFARFLQGPGQILAILTFFARLPGVEDSDVSEDQIRELLAEADEEDIDEPQKELLENVFELDDTDVDEICTHRSEVVSLDMEDTPEEWKQVIHENRHTFYPILGTSGEDVVGILDTRDYFRLDRTDLNSILTRCVDKPLFVAENMKADDLFRQMQQARTYFAVVLDEYGGMTGIVTLHDIMETLFGRMQEADEAVLPDDIRQLGPDSWEIMGSASLEDVEEALGLELPVDDYDTFGGYVLGTYGFIPEDGTQLEIFLDPLAVRVFEIRKHRIGRTVVKMMKSKEEAR